MHGVRDIRMRSALYDLSWALFLLLLFLVFFGSWLMPHGIGPEYRLQMVEQEVNGVVRSMIPPFGPSEDYWLGTDHRGYDILSLLLNGAKYTIGLAFLVTLMRFVLALPLGLLSGVTGKGRNWITPFQLATTAVPPLLFLFPMMYGLNKILPPELTTPVLFLMLVAVGVFPVAHQFAERGAYYNTKLFVTAARTMGASHVRIVFKHLFPHLRPEILYAFLTEMVQVLFLFGQLAVVKIFLGGWELFQLMDATPFTPELNLLLTASGEWGSMIAYGVTVFRQFPWVLFGATAFLVAAIAILTFFGNQLQKRLEEPHLYVNKPLRRHKPRLLWVSGLTAVFAALLLLSQTADRPATSPQPNESPTGEAAPGDGQAAGKEEQMTAKIKQDLEAFMAFLADNKFLYATTYLKEEDNPPHEFLRWDKAINHDGYTYQQIGDITNVTTDAERSLGLHKFQVAIHMKAPDGTPDIWYAKTEVRDVIDRFLVKILSGTGEPGAE